MANRFIFKQLDWWRLTKLTLAIAVSGFIGYYFQPMVADNPNAVNTVVTIFSILAGFLIALITFIAEPALRQARDWKELQLMKDTIRRQLFRQKILFFLYLMTLGIALSMFLVPQSMDELQRWLQVTFLGLAVFVFLASFTLPGSLVKIQMERYDAALDASKPRVLRELGSAVNESKDKK